MENTKLVTACLQKRGLYPIPEPEAAGLRLALDTQGELTLEGSPLDLIDLADLLVSLALSGEDRGQHWHLDDWTLLDEHSEITGMILTRRREP